MKKNGKTLYRSYSESSSWLPLPMSGYREQMMELSLESLEHEATALAWVLTIMINAGNRGTDQFNTLKDRYMTVQECIEIKRNKNDQMARGQGQ